MLLYKSKSPQTTHIGLPQMLITRTFLLLCVVLRAWI